MDNIVADRGQAALDAFKHLVAAAYSVGDSDDFRWQLDSLREELSDMGSGDATKLLAEATAYLRTL